MEDRTCGSCGETKPVTDFYLRGGKGKRSPRSACKVCFKASGDAARTPEKSRKHGLKYSYGIEQSDYDRMFVEQGGKCAICGTEDMGKNKHFCVDHNHTTKAIRGLLCKRCNTAIGLLQDDWMNLKRAADYLLDADSLVIE
jgi:hypothetical protein